MMFNPYGIAIRSHEVDNDHIEIIVEGVLFCETWEKHLPDWTYEQVLAVRSWAAGIISRATLSVEHEIRDAGRRHACRLHGKYDVVCALGGSQTLVNDDDFGDTVWTWINVAPDDADDVTSILRAAIESTIRNDQKWQATA